MTVGLRTMENATYGGSYVGKVTYTNKADTRSFAEKMFSGEVQETHDYNYVKGDDADSPMTRYAQAFVTVQ